MRIRTLPVRFHPAQGEAIDSYIEAYAARIGATSAEFERAVGLAPTHHRSQRIEWLIDLESCELQSLSTATALPTARFRQMTLSHFDGRAVAVDPSRRCLTYGAPWGYARGSRFCPACLADTSGRWSVAWRLNWSFACLIHCCLLAHLCPECGQRQRVRPHPASLEPRPGRCANKAARSARNSLTRCGADLQSAVVLALDEDHPSIVVQRAVYRIISGATPVPSVYCDGVHSALEILSDVRNLACEVLHDPDRAALAGLVPADLIAALNARSGKERTASGGVRSESRRDANPSRQIAPLSALDTAAAVTAAWTCLSEPEVRLAAASVRRILATEAFATKAPVPVFFLQDRKITSTMASVYVGALGPDMSRAEQLRHRVHAHPVPVVPPNSRALPGFESRIPTLFWKSWSVHMPPMGQRSRTCRKVLSVAVMLCGSRTSFGDAVERLHTSLKQHTFNRAFAALDESDWVTVATTVERVSEYLTTERPPIDYLRRRRLDYSRLLPPTVWDQICTQHGLLNLKPCRSAVRLLLIERLSARPAVPSPAESYRIVRFLHQQSPRLASALNHHCRQFLDETGVKGEPLAWAPDIALLSDLRLPNDESNQLNINELHLLVRRGGCGIDDAAQRLGVSRDAILNCLESNPAPKDVRRSRFPDALHDQVSRR